jgi:lysophospholipase L1-like esterase
VRQQQVPHIPRDADLVTVTMGGNDVGYAPVLEACTAAVKDSICTVAVRLAEVAAATVVPVQLTITLMAIKRAAPHARIVVLGYPRLFELGPCRAGVPDAVRRRAINHGTDLLNGVLARTSQLFKARFVDVRGRFAGHGVCAAGGQEWINGPGNGAESYHPTATGQEQGLLPALTSVT